MDRFMQLLDDLGHILNIPLYTDKKRACRLNINNTLYVQLESEDDKERILIATFIHDIPPGKYRENTLKEALKADGRYPRIGTFAYSERNNQLALFEYVPMPELRAEKLADILANIIEKATAWRATIERGVLPLAREGEQKVDRSIFNLKL